MGFEPLDKGIDLGSAVLGQCVRPSITWTPEVALRHVAHALGCNAGCWMVSSGQPGNCLYDQPPVGTGMACAEMSGWGARSSVLRLLWQLSQRHSSSEHF